MSEHIQSIQVPHHVAPTPELAFDLVKSRGLDASVVEESAEGWLFRQAPACDCSPGVICDEDGCRVMRGPVCGCGKSSGSLDPDLGRKTMTRKADDDPPDRDEEEEVVEKEEGDEDEGEEKPPEEEQKALKAGAMWLRGLKMFCKAAGESVEQAEVLKTSQRCIKMGARCTRKVYGDRYKEVGYEDGDDGGESEDDDEPKEKPSDEEKAIASAFEKVMQELLGTSKQYGRELMRNNRTNGR